ncbi:MAG TPA: hypothetical protein VEP30_10680 [Chthoniobacterales bacterium]|nr:hypothetical protein [Chthoniobacterales bacterium]
MNTTALMLAIFIVSCVISVFYWYVVREVLITRIRFRLFAKRDKLRRLAIDRKEQSSSFAYRTTEEFICKTIAVVPSLSLASFVVFMLRNRNQTSSVVDKLHNEASEDLSELLIGTVQDGLRIMVVNSPILICLGVMVICAAWIIGESKMFLLKQAAFFIDELPPSESDEPIGQAA